MYLFSTAEKFEQFLKNVKTYKEAKALAGSLEARLAPSDWISKANKKATELAMLEIVKRGKIEKAAQGGGKE